MTLYSKEEQKILDNDPKVQKAESDLDQMKNKMHVATMSLWSSLLTINSIFLALFSTIFNRNLLNRIDLVLFSCLITIPIFSVLLLFIINKSLIGLNYKLTLSIYSWILDKLLNKSPNESAKNAKDNRDKTVKIAVVFNFINCFLETTSIICTALAIFLILRFLIHLN